MKKSAPNTTPPCKKSNKHFHRFLILSFWEGIFLASVLLISLVNANAEDILNYSFPRLSLIIIAFLVIVNTALGSLILSSLYSNKLYEKIQEKTNFIIWILIIPFSTSVFLLSHWLFINTENRLYAYLKGFTPLLGYIIIICIQTIVLIIKTTSERHKLKRTWSVFILFTFSILSFLFIGEYVFVDFFFDHRYLVREYAEILQSISLALSLATFYFLFSIFFLQKKIHNPINFTWNIIFVIIVLGYFYYDAASLHAQENNTTFMSSDQNAFIITAKKAHQSNFSYMGNGNQMPLSAYMQAVFYTPEMSDEVFFEQGKQRNIILSLIFLIILFFVFRNYLSLKRTVIITMVVATSAFIFRSPYFTSEVLYYFLSFLSVLFMGKMLIKPSFGLSIISGIFLAFTHLTKASILPAIIAFVFVFLLNFLVVFIKNKKRHFSWQPLLQLSLLLITFLVILFPYLNKSKEKYGKYFYNVNTTFYMWHDDFIEAKQDENILKYIQDRHSVSSEELPSFKKYLNEHSWIEIQTRVVDGFKAQLFYLNRPGTKLNYLLLYASILALMLLTLKKEIINKIMCEHWKISIFFLLNWGGYFFLNAWYSPISAGGGRFVYALFVPTIFFFFLATDRIARDNTIINPERLNIIENIIFSLVVLDFYYVITIALPGGYFGS